MSAQFPKTTSAHQLSTKNTSKFINQNNNQRYHSFLSQQITPNQTMRLKKLKNQLNEYLNKKIVSDNQQHFVQSVYNSKSPVFRQTAHRQKKAYSQQGKYHKNVNFSQTSNLYHEKRQKSLKKSEKLKGRKSAEQNIEEISKQSFLIKQIKPEVKDRLSKNHQINSPQIGKTFGSYYQIVALQKKFQNSQYFYGNRNRFIGNRSPYLQQKYRSRIHNPQNNNLLVSNNNKIRYKEQQINDVSKIEPWKNLNESIIVDF